MNIGHNLAFIRRKGVKNLRDLAVAENKINEGSALVIAGGPSIHIHDHLNVIKNSGYKGAIVSSDRMLIPCLENNIVPNYVMTVDGADIILKFYKHRLFRENLKNIKVLLHYTTSPKVVRYLYRLKADVYWFIVHTEQVVRENSDVLGAIYMTMTAHNPEGLQTLVAGGNVGVCAWCFSWVVLNRNPVILIGFDMGYPEGTDLRKTYYYSTIFDATLAALKEPTAAALAAQMQYTKEYNPAFRGHTYTDSVFRSYREMFCAYLEHAPPKLITINSTEGGALYHPRLQYGKLAETLEKYRE
jgi:hypothetical protein